MPGRDWNIGAELEGIRASGLWRSLRVIDGAQGVTVEAGGRTLTNFSSNDYLGLAGSPALAAALEAGARRFGAGSGASRLVCGTLNEHMALEGKIAAFKRTEAALCFSAGYAVALGVIPALMQAGDTIILDKLCHASLVDASRLSGATIRVFPHNHLGKLQRLLEGGRGRVLVVTESIFSMDGDAAALAEMVELKDRHGARLLVDEAHATGIIGPQGRGLGAALGVESRIDLHMGTLSKAVGLAGGYLAADRATIELLINRARSFIYSTAPPPALCHAAGVAVDLIASEEGDALRSKLRGNADLFLHGTAQAGVPVAPSASAIFPIVVGDEMLAMALSRRLLDEGFLIPAIRYPTVARGSARLRVTLSAAHEGVQIERLAMHLGRAMAELR